MIKFNKSIATLTIGTIAGISTFLPLKSWSADNSILDFSNGIESAVRMRQAIDEVTNDSAILNIMKDKTRSLSLSQRVTGKYGETTKFQAYYNGLEVIGDMALHHRTQNGTRTTNKITRFDLDTVPTLSSEDAVAIAKTIGQDKELAAAPVLEILPSKDQSAKLVYLVELNGDGFQGGLQVLIDAHTGAIIAEMPTHIDLAPIQVFAANEKCQTLDKDGRPSQIRPSECDQVVKSETDHNGADASALRAAENSEKTLKYYNDYHKRDSYDGHGAEISSVVHVGSKFANAFWDAKNKIMAYGDGDGVEMGDMTLGLDVAGHEITHAVTSSTAKLMHLGESGALNESYSDFFGKMIENNGNWAIGHKLFKASNSQGLRLLSNPGVLIAQRIKNPETGAVTSFPYPAKLSEKIPEPSTCTAKNDFCWVHGNSTIPSHAAYLIYQAIGKASAETIIYATLTQYLTASSDFQGSRDSTIEACKDLYSSAVCDKVTAAYKAVGL